MAKIQYLAPGVLSRLRESVRRNLSRYRADGFADMAGDARWGLSLDIDYDIDLLETLPAAQTELDGSRIVGRSLASLTPAVANEEQMWARLSHVEGFEYSRQRWLADGADDEAAEKSILTHFFAPSQTGLRDDHALSRLWWNYHIAATCMPDAPEEVLALILRTADIRSNFVERIWTTSRRPIAAGILRSMQTNPWLTAVEKNFRAVMKAVNRNGGGVVFESLSVKLIDEFVEMCVSAARDQGAGLSSA